MAGSSRISALCVAKGQLGRRAGRALLAGSKVRGGSAKGGRVSWGHTVGGQMIGSSSDIVRGPGNHVNSRPQR